jgi:diacylglycerol O-acyltransferase / wax synthase
MATTRLLERLNAQDFATLLWDGFGWSGDIGVLAVLDGTGLLDEDGHVRIDEVRAAVESRLHRVPRFRQRLYRPPLGLGWPVWIDADGFALADHVRVYPLTAGADEGELLAACERLRQHRLDVSRPLWDMWLLPGLPDRRVGLYLRAHHVMVDGVSGVEALGALLDLTADALVHDVPAWVPAACPSKAELLRDNLRRRLQGLRRASSGFAKPSRTVRGWRQTWPAWREFFAEERAPRTSLNRPVGVQRRLAIVRSRLDLAKQVAHAHDAKVNDVVLVAVAGGLRELLGRRAEPVNELVLRAEVFVSLHREDTGGAGGNLDSAMVVPLPLGEPDPIRRLQLIAAQTAQLKRRTRPQVSSGIFRFILAQRALLIGLARQRMMNLTVSNVPGPPVPLYLAGARLLEVFPLTTIVANMTLGVCVLSYSGQLNFTAVADRDAHPDLDAFIHGVQATLDELARSVVPAPQPTPR